MKSVIKKKIFYPPHFLFKYKKGIKSVVFWSILPNYTSRFVFRNLLWFKKKKNTSTIDLYFNDSLAGAETQVRLFQNSLIGISRKYRLELWVKGVGFKFRCSGSHILFSFGFSHLVKIQIPSGCEIIPIGKRKLLFKGICLQKLTQFISYIQNIKLPDAYLGKGVNFKYKTTVTKLGKKQAI